MTEHGWGIHNYRFITLRKMATPIIKLETMFIITLPQMTLRQVHPK